MRKCALAAMFAMQVAAATVAAAPSQADLARTAAMIVERTNVFRVSEGLHPVEANAMLERTAQQFADFMARTGEYGHEADGSTPAERAKRHGYDYCSVSENISFQYSSSGFTTLELATRLTEGWKRSPGHRKNMLDAHVTETGVALARNPRTGYHYAVQMFGRPRSLSVHFTVRNAAGQLAKYRVGEEQFSLSRGAEHTHTRCISEAIVAESGHRQSAPTAARDGVIYMIVREGDGLAIRQRGSAAER